jgi:steroid 5-alpha reductase family enzyme
MKQKNFIDTQKGLTGIAVLLMMAYYDQWGNITAWVYLALHGSYGLMWVLKSRIFPDRQWEKSTSLAFGLVIWAGLSLYWVAPWLLTSSDVQAPYWYLAICMAIYIFGIFSHFTTDMQKYTSLKINPGYLITGGMMARVRNLNYFGELLIYGSFAMLAEHWLPFVILLTWISIIWIPKMLKKDRSLSRYPDFRAYRERTKLFIPFIY